MENPKFFWGFIAILAVIIFCKFLYRNHAQVGRYEYLEVLRFDNWKDLRVIRLELEKKHGGWLSVGDVIVNLNHLIEEDLVERRLTEDEDGMIAEYKKKSGGRKVRDSSPATPSFSPSLQPA